MTTSSGETVEEVIVEWNVGHDFAFEIPGGIRPAIRALRESWAVEPAPEGCNVVLYLDSMTSAHAVKANEPGLGHGRSILPIGKLSANSPLKP